MGKHAGFGVVFVHGFKSSPAMWDAFGRLMASDTDLEAVTPMRFQYATRLVQPGPLRRIPTFDTVADSLKEFMDTEAEGFSHLALVAHSQGGLVVQRFLARMLIEGRGEELKRIRRVVLFACPNNGSGLGLKLRRWTLRANPQERQLRPFDEQITDTQGIVLRDIVNADVATERTCPIPFSVYAGETDNVVTPASARGVFPDVGSCQVTTSPSCALTRPVIGPTPPSSASCWPRPTPIRRRTSPYRRPSPPRPVVERFPSRNVHLNASAPGDHR